MKKHLLILLFLIPISSFSQGDMVFTPMKGALVCPDSVFQMNMLNSNFIHQLPDDLSQMTSLKKIDCTCSLEEFENIIANNQNLEEIRVQITSDKMHFPCSILTLKKLKKLVITWQSYSLDFVPLDCNLKGLKNLESIHFYTIDCCWPYLKITPEQHEKLLQQLPENCVFHGYRPLNIESDIELR